MKRIKTRRKSLRITNPIGFSLFVAGCLLALGVIAVIITLAVGYGGDAMRYVQDQIQGTVEDINEQPTFTPEPTEAPTETPEPKQTPEVGTPAPTATATPEPIGSLEDTPEPTVDPNSPLIGFTIGINPGRDISQPKYAEECAFNLEFSQGLAEYLRQRGATVILTRMSNDIKLTESERGKLIKAEGCDIALEIFCNHMKASSRGCYARYGGSKEYAQQLANAYHELTGIPFQSNHKSGIYHETENVIHYSGCPCVRLVMGNWENTTDRGILQDHDFWPRVYETITSVLIGRLKD